MKDDVGWHKQEYAMRIRTRGKRDPINMSKGREEPVDNTHITYARNSI